MSRQLLVRTMAGDHIGTVAVGHNGSLIINATTLEVERQLREIVESLVVKPVRRRAGKRETLVSGVLVSDLARNVTPSDPEFLAALKDELFGRTVGGFRIKGTLVDAR